MKPTKIKNLVPESYRQFLYNLTTSHDFDWRWFDYSSYDSTDKITQLVHPLSLNNTTVSKHYESFKSLLYFFEDRTGIQIKNILKLKVNLKPQTNVYSEEEIDASIHKDMLEDNNYISIVYYINDSDGDTVVYDEDKKTVVESMTPSSGGCIYFNSNQWHKATPPKETSKRLIVNIVVQV